jgi:hypothetical protein
MKIKLNIIIAFSLVCLAGCDTNSSDPKVQGAIQIEKMLKQGNKRALNEGIKLLKENKDFIINTTNAEICIYELDGSHIEKTELGVEIQKTFEGQFEKNTTFYAAKLPIGTKAFYEPRNSTQFMYVEVSRGKDRIYRCQQFFKE